MPQPCEVVTWTTPQTSVCTCTPYISIHVHVPCSEANRLYCTDWKDSGVCSAKFTLSLLHCSFIVEAGYDSAMTANESALCESRALPERPCLS